tara:strand:+ start:125 stop:850 length:726 start_codon:yes stop_codon:yes gene_type:complete
MKKSMLILIILGSIISGISAIFQYVDKEKNEEGLNSKIDSLRDDNSELKKELKILSNDNVKLSHQLTETALKLNETVTGESELDIEINTNKITEFSFRFVNNNDLPVNNANIMVQDYSKIINCEINKETKDKVFIKSDCYSGHFIKYSSVTFNPQTAFLDSNKRYPFTKEYMNFAIQIETKKKTIIYHLVYKRIQGDMVRSMKTYDLINNKKIFVEEENYLKLDNDFWSKCFYEKVLYTIE